MADNSQISLQPSYSAEKISEKNESKDDKSTLSAIKAQNSVDDKSFLMTAKAQDSLMTVNDQKPLQASTSAEKTILQEPEIDRQNVIQI